MNILDRVIHDILKRKLKNLQLTITEYDNVCDITVADDVNWIATIIMTDTIKLITNMAVKDLHYTDDGLNELVSCITHSRYFNNYKPTSVKPLR